MIVDVPGYQPISLKNLVLDFTGTLSKDGVLLDGVESRLSELSKTVHIVVLTADTFGTAAKALEGLPVELKIINSGKEKADYVERVGAASVAAIGNGRNDVPMCRVAALSVAVMGPEGVASELLRSVHIVVPNICDALDLLAMPLRVRATLRD